MWVNGFQTLLPDRKECLLRNWQAIVLSQSHFSHGDSPFYHSSSSRFKATDHAHRPLEIPNVSLSVLKFRSNPAFPAQEPKSGQEKKDDWRPRSKNMLGGRPRPKMRMKIQLWPWLPVITGYFYGIIHSINGVLLVLITYNWSMAITVGVGKGGTPSQRMQIIPGTPFWGRRGRSQLGGIVSVSFRFSPKKKPTWASPKR